MEEAARRCLALVEVEELRCQASVAGVEQLCLAWEEVEEWQKLVEVEVEEGLLPRAVVGRDEMLTAVKEEVRRARVAEEEGLGSESSAGGAEVPRVCLALEEVEERALCSVVEVVRQRAHDCQRTVEARRTLYRLASLRRSQASSVAVVEVGALDLQHSMMLALCSEELVEDWRTCRHLRLGEVL